MAKGTRSLFPTQCKQPGCPNLTKLVYCEEHKDKRKVYDRTEYRASPSKRGYNRRWQRYRKNYLAKHPLCVECGKPATVVDHIVPHKGSYDLFWNEENVQALCEACHNRKTATEDMGSWDTHQGLQ